MFEQYPTESERARWIAILEELGYKIIPPKTKAIESLKERKEVFKNKLRPYLQKYGSDMLNNFFLYWTQTNEGGTKMLWEKQKAFQLSNRLATWYRNNYGKQKTSTEQKLHQDGTILHQGQMNVAEGGW